MHPQTVAVGFMFLMCIILGLFALDIINDQKTRKEERVEIVEQLLSNTEHSDYIIVSNNKNVVEVVTEKGKIFVDTVAGDWILVKD